MTISLKAPDRPSLPSGPPVVLQPSRLSRLGFWLTACARTAVYAAPALRRRIERQPPAPDKARAQWDHMLSEGGYDSYLGATVHVDGANAMTALLVRHHGVAAPSVLDVGTSGGTLARALPGFSAYMGIDVSAVAIAAARKAAPAPGPGPSVRFDVADLREFRPATAPDFIVFNEVLYYLTVDLAVAEVRRYAATLTGQGMIVILMKNDGKSRAIFRRLEADFDWVDGILWQRKPAGFDFAIRTSRACPGFLAAALRPRR